MNRFCGSCGAVIVPVAVSTAPIVPTDSIESREPEAQTSEVQPPSAVASPVASPVAATAPPISPQPGVAPNRPTASPDAVDTRLSGSLSAGLTFTGVALERERDRLLTLVNVQRMRGQTGEARKTLEQIVALSEGLPPRDIAPTQELIGDLFAADEKWDAALEAFRKARDLDPARPSAERKFAELTLRLSDIQAEKRLAEAMMRGDDITSMLAGNALATGRGRRNAGVAMLLSAAIPGFGQFYNGELVKGAVVLALFALSLLYAILSGDLDTVVSKVTSLVTISAPTISHGHGTISSRVSQYSAHPLSVFSILIGILLVGVWLYAIVDAIFMAAKTPKNELGPAIDKTGWEV